MNKKAMKKTSRDVADKLTFRRETIRSLRADEAARVVGGFCSGVWMTCHFKTATDGD
jgi:hypothetical protein